MLFRSLLGRLHVKAQSPLWGPWGNGPQAPGGGFPGGPGIEPSRPAPAHLPGASRNFIGARAGSWLPCFLLAMLIIRNRDLTPARPWRAAPLAFALQPALCAAFLRPTSLAPSDCVSSLLSEGWSLALKQSGLGRSVPYSATQNLAYLPCRIESYVSIFRFLVGGIVSKKTSARKTPKTIFSSRNYRQVCGHVPDLVSRSISMRFENHHEAANVFRPDLRVLPLAPPQRGSGRLHRAAAGGRPPLEPHASLRAHPGVLRRELFLPRCCQKGCVFPAQPGGDGECAYHRRQSLEPGCFQSQQPTFLLLDQAKFGLPDTEPDDWRVRDRHRLAEERVEFMLGDAA